MSRSLTQYFYQNEKTQIKRITYLIIIIIATLFLNLFNWKRYSEIEIEANLDANQNRYFYIVTNKMNYQLKNYQLHLEINNDQKNCYGNLEYFTPSGKKKPKKEHKVFLEKGNWIRFGGPEIPLANGAAIWIYCNNLPDEAIRSIEAEFRGANFTDYGTCEMKIVKYNKFFPGLKFFLQLFLAIFGILSSAEIFKT